MSLEKSLRVVSIIVFNVVSISAKNNKTVLSVVYFWPCKKTLAFTNVCKIATTSSSKTNSYLRRLCRQSSLFCFLHRLRLTCCSTALRYYFLMSSSSCSNYRSINRIIVSRPNQSEDCRQPPKLPANRQRNFAIPIQFIRCKLCECATQGNRSIFKRRKAFLMNLNSANSLINSVRISSALCGCGSASVFKVAHF